MRHVAFNGILIGFFAVLVMVVLSLPSPLRVQSTGEAATQQVASDAYAPPIDIFDSNRDIVSVPSHVTCASAGSTSIPIVVSAPESAIYATGYWYNNNQWVPVQFNEEASDNWVLGGTATATLSVDCATFADQNVYFVTWVCKRVGTTYKCGCRASDDCGYWMLATVNLV